MTYPNRHSRCANADRWAATGGDVERSCTFTERSAHLFTMELIPPSIQLSLQQSNHPC